MSIASSAQAWDRDDETGVSKAVRILELRANSREESEFLAAFSACIVRGRVDPKKLMRFAIDVAFPDET